MFGPDFRDFVSQKQSRSSKILKKSDSRDSGAGKEFEILEQEEIEDHHHSEDSGNYSEAEGEFEVLDGKIQEMPANPCDILPEDLSPEYEILANFPDGCNGSLIVESKDEGSFDIIPKSFTFDEMTNILNQATQEDNCEKLDEVIQNIEDYESTSITLGNVNLKSFCEQQLNLDLNRSDHQHVYSNVLSQYKFNQEGFNYDYSVKELVLLAIAANDKLTEKYQDRLFTKENLILLPLLIGGQKYIEAFIGRFHDTDRIYGRLKDQTIQLVEPNNIGFFSVIALRKEQKLLNTVLVEYVLRDFGQVLKTIKLDPLYGVLETASLIKNEGFITIVLDAFERYINELTKKASTEELLKKIFATLLETAISQEHISVVEYLCKRYTNSTDHAIYDVYEQAFADDKVITVLRKQILENIGVRERKEIYDLILKTALDAGNIAFIEHLCKECAERSNDVISYLNQKFKNNEFDNIYESILIALSNVEYTNTGVIVEVLFYTKEIHQNVSHNEQVVRQVIQNILKNATHYSIGQEDYSLVKGVCYLCTEIDAINIIFQEKCKIFKSGLEKRIEDLEKEDKLLQSKALREHNYNYLPDIVNGLAQAACTVYDEYTKYPKYNKRQENTDLILSLMQIRNILQFSIDVQEYPCHERGDWWDKMNQTSGTFIIRERSNNVADELAIPVIKSDILSGNPGFESAGSKEPQENVDKRKNITDNEKSVIEKAIGNDCEKGKMYNSDKNIKEALSDAICNLNYEKVDSLVEHIKQEGNNVKRIINWALGEANKRRVKKEDKDSKGKIKKIKGLLAREIKSIAAALPVHSNAESISATASGQGIPPMVKFEKSELNSLPLGSENDDYPKLKSDESARDSLGSSIDSPFEEINEARIPVIETTKSVATAITSRMSSMVIEESKFKHSGLNDEKDDQQNLIVPTVSNTVSEDFSTSRSDSGLPPLSQQSPVSDEDITGNSDDNSSGSGRSSSIQNTVNKEEPVLITTRQPNDSEYDKTVPQEGQGDVAIRNIQLKTLVVDSKPSNTGVESDGKKRVHVQPNEPVSKKDDNEKNAQPKLAPEQIPTSSVANGSSGQDDEISSAAGILNSEVSIKDNTSSLDTTGHEHSEDSPVVSGDFLVEDITDEKEPLLDKTNKGGSMLKNSNSLQSTKSSKLFTVVTWTLAVAGVLAGVAVSVAYFAFGASLLVAGITAGIGALCLVAAAAMYCLHSPASSLKDVNAYSSNKELAETTVS